MALFSRRKKSDGTDAPAEESTQEESPVASEEEQDIPEVAISVQAFRGVGAQAGPAVSLPDENPSATPAGPVPRPTVPVRSAAEPGPRRLPLAPVLPPAQTETVPGMRDNVLLRTALAELGEKPTNEQLIGVLRQALQGHLYLRVHGDARALVSEGKPLSVGVIRDGERSFMLAFSSAGAVRAALQREETSAATSAIAQPVMTVLQQVVSGGFTGLIIDNASAPHRAVFPSEILQRALEQSDVDMTVKTLLATPHDAQTPERVGEALTKAKTWVAVGNGEDGAPVGIAEAQTADGRRFLQIFSHPLEVVALGRGERPMPFTPERLGKILNDHTELAGVIVDPAGPTVLVEREALVPVMALAVDLGD